MHLSVLRKGFRDLRWQVIGYGIAFALMGAFVVYLYPSYKDQLANLKLPEATKALVGNADYASPEGFISAEFFSWVPALLVVFAIMAGTSALAGEEAAGTLELLLGQPILRSQIALQKMGAILAAALGIAAMICFGWLVSIPFVDMHLSLGRCVIATFAMVPNILFFGALAMLCAAILPDRRLATAIASGLAVLTFFLNYLATLVDKLKPLRFASPFHYNSAVLPQGLDVAGLMLIFTATVLLAGTTIAAFEQRDIGAHIGISLPRLGKAL